MSGATARNPRAPSTGSWCRQLSDNSGQPCTNTTSGPSSGPDASSDVVWSPILRVCWVTSVTFGMCFSFAWCYQTIVLRLLRPRTPRKIDEGHRHTAGPRVVYAHDPPALQRRVRLADRVALRAHMLRQRIDLANLEGQPSDASA